MKRLKTILFGSVLFLSYVSQAQEYVPDSVIAARESIRFADSLTRSHFYQEWKTYLALTNYSAIKYYGGNDQYQEHVVTLYYRNAPKHDEKPESLRLLELKNQDSQWQCVIEKVRRTFIDDKKAVVTSYLVGQSMDDGRNWKFIDVSQNTMENVIHIMPTLFTDMAIPEGKTIFPDQIVAQPEEAPKAAPKKKVVTKKR